MPIKVQRGNIVWVDFGPVRGRCKAGAHPAVVVQNNVGNQFSPMTIVVPLTDPRQFKNLPVQVLLTSGETGLANKDSCVECGHVTTIDGDAQIDQAKGIVSTVQPAAMAKIDAALRKSVRL